MFASITPPTLASSARGLVPRWAVDPQQRARRNAMLAATECAQRRAEREEVETFFAALAAPREAEPARRTAHG